jgi:hypothetical protein
MQGLWTLTLAGLVWTTATIAWDTFNLPSVPKILDTLSNGDLIWEFVDDF